MNKRERRSFQGGQVNTKNKTLSSFVIFFIGGLFLFWIMNAFSSPSIGYDHTKRITNDAITEYKRMTNYSGSPTR